MTSETWPKPRIPVRPALSVASFSTRRKRALASVLDAPHIRYVTSGRVAIALALRELDVKSGDEVLVPAFHCSSMIEPVTWLGATPVFYRIMDDTAVDLADIERRVNPLTRALLVTHYFGFLQDTRKLRAFCDSRRLALIEDCAHCFFGEIDGQPVGKLADYAIASVIKFFPTYDGGCLLSSTRPLDHIRLRSAGYEFEMKATANTFEYALEYGRFNVGALLMKVPLKLKDRIWHRVKSSRFESAAIGPGSSDGAYGFESDWIDKRISLSARFILKTTSRSRIVNRRRQHYLALHEALAHLPGAQPLFSGLPEWVAPYVYPLKVDYPERVFPALKNQGVPILRFGEHLWPEMDPRTCPVSQQLSRRLLQFPCHQEFAASELGWMIQCISQTLRGANEQTLRPNSVAL